MKGISNKFSLEDKNKVFWTLLFIVLLSLLFWLFSRYPALDSKSIMEGAINFEGIAFDQVISVSEDAPAYKKIITNTINWMETNRNGMTFGILFAAALMLLFSLLENIKFKHPFLNSIIGMLIGLPLGVCVNCAAPIAQGIYKGGGRAETALSMMISSPTLNIVVLTMTFSIFPFYLAFLKVILSLIVILIAVPIITKVFFSKIEPISTDELDQKLIKNSITPFQPDIKESMPSESLFDALGWFIKSYWKRLWYIIKMTVPLMLLAGLLGNILIQYLPWETLGEIGIYNSLGISLLVMLAIAIVGLALPVPMTFDVIVVAVLIAAGLSPLFSMVLLFTLGSFSIYSFFIVWQTFHLKLALSLSFVIIFLSIAGGLIAHKYAQVKEVEKVELFKAAFTSPNIESPKQIYFPSNQIEYSYDAIANSIKDNVQVAEVFKTYPKKEITVEFLPFKSSTNSDDKEGIAFKRLTGKEVGLSLDLSFDIKNEFSQISQSSCISAGDIQNDGWQDLIVTSMNGVYLFMNTGNGNYQRQSFDITSLADKLILTAVLVDLNNDDLLDLFIGTYQEGNYILLNNSGDLLNGELVSLGNDSNSVITLAPAFADVDRNSSIDIYSGNWSIGMMGHNKRGFKSSINYLMKNPLEEDSREVTKLEGPTGETLTSLFSDFNNDGIQDLIVGNDFHMPELFYQGQKNGDFELITASDSIVPISTMNCMSIDGIDLNNDLINEYFMAGSADRDLPIELFKTADTEICMELIDKEEREQCQLIMQLHKEIVRFRNTKEINNAPEDFEKECIAFDILLESVNSSEKTKLEKNKICDYIPTNKDWAFIKWICEFDRNDTTFYSKEEVLNSIPSVRKRSVMLQKKSENKFEDVSEALNLGITGWTWNAQFADFDNDQFADVLTVNGSFHGFTREPNFLFKNVKGKEFVDVSEETNMNSYLPSYSYVYTDFDNDGDLDIIMPPALAPIQFYENVTTGNNSIVIELKDTKGNRQGIGSKIKIYYGDKDQKQMREIKASGGYRSFNAIEAWFGLGSFEIIKKISIEWSTGEKQVLEGPFPAGNRYIIHRSSLVNS